MNGSASAPSSAATKGTHCAIRPEMKATSRERRSSFATTTGHLLCRAEARAAASRGRRSGASAPLPVSTSVNSEMSAIPSVSAIRATAERCASRPEPDCLYFPIIKAVRRLTRYQVAYIRDLPPATSRGPDATAVECERRRFRPARAHSAETLIADKGYDSDAFREALAGSGITPCIPPRAKRRLPLTYCKTLYRRRHKVENMFARLKEGGVSQCATTAAPTHSSALPASRQPLSFGSVK